MEPNAASPAPDASGSFQPLPTGQQAEKVTPERFRQQLGWALLQSGLRQGGIELCRD